MSEHGESVNSREFVEELSKQGREFCIIGLTGKVRSGTSQVCKLLTQCDYIKCMDLPQNITGDPAEAREYRIIYRYLRENWKPFVELDVTSVIVSYILDLGYEKFCKNSSLTVSASNILVTFKSCISGDNKDLFKDMVKQRIIESYSSLRYCLNNSESFEELTNELTEYLNRFTTVEELFKSWVETKSQIVAENPSNNTLVSYFFCFGILPVLAERIKEGFEDKDSYPQSFQDFGNSIRATGSVESVCIDDKQDIDINESNLFSLPERINQFIKVLRKTQNNALLKATKNAVFVVINNFKNIFEAYYFKRRYSAFYLMAVSCDENSRREEFKDVDKFFEMNLREDLSAGKKLYKAAVNSNCYREAQDTNDLNRLRIELQRELSVNRAETNFLMDILSDNNRLRRRSYDGNIAPFILQDVVTCIENADIFVTRDYKEKTYKYDHQLIKQLARMVTLILHPGILVPTKIERCMQIAMTAKLNSGCLSRQVGAIVTDRRYNILSLGWNDAPCGAETCIRRNFFDLARKSDSMAYSDYELKNPEFRNYVEEVNNVLNSMKSEMNGLPMAFCFKDIHQDLIKQRDQIYTRALHGEERALASCNNELAKGGYLFTTSSPCELCAKRAKEAGISKIYYIQLYPGISKDHVIEIGLESTRAEYEFFVGAVGLAYIKLYTPLIPYKDELAALNFSPSDVHKKLLDAANDTR